MSDQHKEEPDKVENEDDNPERGNWSGTFDFLLSCLGYAVGLGNVWKFPYLCYKHGGGAFLVPYTIMLLLIGIPCFFLEISIGQYSGNGPITLYSNLAPMFKGLGLSNFLSSCFVALYYNMIIAWTIFYMFASMKAVMPWINCGNQYNSEFCFSVEDYRNCNESRANGNISANAIYHNGTCISDPESLETIRNNMSFFYGCEVPYSYLKDPSDQCSVAYNHSVQLEGIYVDLRECVALKDIEEINTTLFDIPVKKRQSSSGEYLSKSVLNESDGIFPLGEIQWHLSLCLLGAWIIIFLCLFKGIKSSGKVVYFTATFPYVILLILLIRAVTLEGAMKGIRFYMVPKWDKLFDTKIWQDAASQIFFSLSVGGGGLITLASYNKFHNNVVRDTFIVCLGNCFTSVFAGFAIFSVLGFLATKLGVEVDDVVKSGPGLAFEAYPDLVSQLNPAWLWAVLFFFMLFTLGLDSQFAMTETVLSGIIDYKPSLRKYKTYIIGAICVVGFLLGLPLTTRGGSYLLDLLDTYAANWTILYIGLMECLIISYSYGLQKFLRDLNAVCKFKLHPYLESYFITFYSFITPAIILAILLTSIFNHEGMKRGSYNYPQSATDLGLSIALIIMLVVPFIAIIQICIDLFTKRQNLSLAERIGPVFKKLLTHRDEWRDYERRVTRNEPPKSGIDNYAMSDK